jgi:myo-inositol catabolism protein IolS
MARIGTVDKEHPQLALGCWTFGGAQWGGQEDPDSREAMEKAFELGITHFDTASGYGGGRSERVVGEFIRDKRDAIFLASKQGANAKMEKYAASIRSSLERLGTDYIDLYYIHWPNSKFDLRPSMEALVRAKEAGIVGAIGVSNFSIEQMEQVSEVGTIDANQLCYNLLWRWDEADIIPYCREHGIAVVSYSSIAQGILTGKFPKAPEFRDGDQRPSTTLFDPDVWPVVYDAVERMKPIAADAGRPLAHLAVRWVAKQPGITSILVGVRNAAQVAENAAAMEGEIDDEIFDRITRVSDRAKEMIPDTGNIFRYYP